MANPSFELKVGIWGGGCATAMPTQLITPLQMEVSLHVALVTSLPGVPLHA